MDGERREGGGQARHGILSLTIREKSALHAAYMPYIKGGGLFIPTDRPFRLGEEVFLLLTLMDEPEKIPMAGRVVWITPPGAQNNRVAGIGIQFSEKEGERARNKIETYLAGKLQSDTPTHTI